MWLSVGLALVVAVLLVWVEHWLPWGRLLGRKLPRLVAYVMGVGAIVLPLTGVMVAWDAMGVVMRGWMVIAALWVIVACTGLAVGLAWGFDNWLDLRSAKRAAEGERDVMMSELDKIQEALRDQGTIER